MRQRAWWAIGCAIVGFGLGFAGRSVDALAQMAGFFWLAAIILGIASLPIWARVLPEVPPMDGLFRKVGEGERWCALCGTPAPKDEACGVCGAPPKLKQERPKKVKKSRANKPQKP